MQFGCFWVVVWRWMDFEFYLYRLIRRDCGRVSPLTVMVFVALTIASFGCGRSTLINVIIFGTFVKSSTTDCQLIILVEVVFSDLRMWLTFYLSISKGVYRLWCLMYYECCQSAPAIPHPLATSFYSLTLAATLVSSLLSTLSWSYLGWRGVHATASKLESWSVMNYGLGYWNQGRFMLSLSPRLITAWIMSWQRTLLMAWLESLTHQRARTSEIRRRCVVATACSC